jgi:hypothetical protein
MKFVLSLIYMIILSSPFILIQSIQIKTDNKNSLNFSNSNYNFKQNDQPRLMENIVFNKNTKVHSRIVRKKIKK